MSDEWGKLLINYRNLMFQEPPSQKNWNNILALIKFFVKHCEVLPNGTISFKYHQIPRECISGFNEENPQF